MNPWSLVLILVGVFFVVVGFKGTQDNLLSGLVGHKIGSPTLG